MGSHGSIGMACASMLRTPGTLRGCVTVVFSQLLCRRLYLSASMEHAPEFRGVSSAERRMGQGRHRLIRMCFRLATMRFMGVYNLVQIQDSPDDSSEVT